MFDSGYPGGSILLSNAPAVVNVTGVTLNSNSITMKPGDTYSLITTLSPSSVTYPAVTYSSSNPAVATVSATGVITAKTLGTARITVTTLDGNFTAYCDVNITLTTLNDLNSENRLTIFANKTGANRVLLNITGFDSNEPIEIRLSDVLGRIYLNQKSVIPNEGKIQIQTNLPENLKVGVVQVKHQSGKMQSVKVFF